MNHRARRLSFSALLVAGLAAAGLIPASPAGVLAQPPPDAVPFEGTQAFRRYVLHDLYQLTPLASVQELDEIPNDTLLIVFGQVGRRKEPWGVAGRLEGFRKRGGALLIASDRPTWFALESWGLKISGDLVHQFDGRAYHQFQACPLLTGFIGSDHPLFQRLQKGLATNQPSYLVPGRSDLQVLATFPRGCRKLPPYGDYQDLHAPPAYIVGSPGASPPAGRMVVIAGHGLFMNGMMAQRDNDNFQFACNCVRWLTDGGKRKRVLLLEEGSVQGEFDVPLKALPLPPLPPAHAVDKLLRGLEEEGFFDRLVLALFSRDRILAALLLVASVGLLLYGARRLVRARHRIETAVPLTASGQLAAGDRDLPVMTQRYRDVVWAGNLWEAARALARSCFDPATDGLPGRPAPALPVAVAGGWRQRWTLARQVRRVWELAYGPRPVPVSPSQFARLGAVVQSVRAALADGTLRFPGPPAAH
jgi:hypothetical protein